MDAKTSSTELHYILEKLVALHGNLCELLREEYAHMISVDTKALGEAAHAKEVILSEIWNHEQLRIKKSHELCAQLGLSAAHATLSAIAEKFQGPDGEKFKAARKSLSLLVTQAKELNTRNMEFASSSLARIEEMKRNVLGLGKTAIKENYSHSGSRQPITEQGGRLLSTEA